MRTLIRTLLHFIANWFFNSLCLYACSQWLPGMKLTPIGNIPLYILVMELGLALTVMNTTLRPILLLLLLPLNGLTVGLFSIALNGIFILMLDRLSPAFTVSSFWTGLAAVFIFAVLNMILQIFLPLDDDIIYFSIMGERRAAKNMRMENAKGIIMLEIDGLSYPRMMKAVESGRMPFLKDLLKSGLYTARAYDCGVPSQTSSCQAGIMYGRNENICAYRWYSKTNGRVYSSSSPKDASDMERMLFNGGEISGILNNGMSVNNIISGNASENIFTISRMIPGSRDEINKLNRNMYLFALRPYLLTKSLLLTFLDAGREVLLYFFDVIRQKSPRVNRIKGFYPIIRGATNILLRDLSTAMVTDAVAEGKEAVYTTFLGYDEIAHHSGPDSHEAINALGGIDRAIRKIYEAIQITNARTYEMVVLSDHGQSYGATFKQRYGISLADYITSLAVNASFTNNKLRVVSIEDADDNSVNVAAVLSSLSGEDRSRLVRETAGNIETVISEVEKDAIKAAENESNDILVLASGNLVNAYFQDKQTRMTLEEIETIYPGLVTKLADHPGVGSVFVHTENGPVVFGKDGSRNLLSGEIVGTDPLLMYGAPELRAEQLRYLLDFPDGGDLVIISPVYEDGTVAAYEELIGSHGGLGGQQTEPFLFYSAEIDLDREINNSREVYGALQQIKNTPILQTVEDPGTKKTGFMDLLKQIVHVKNWIFVLARTMFFSPTAYQQVAWNESFDGPALLVGAVSFFSTWIVLTRILGRIGASPWMCFVWLSLVYAIEMIAGYMAIIIFRGYRHPWVMIRTMLFSSYFGLLWLFLLTGRVSLIWIPAILLLRVTTMAFSVVTAGNLKRRFSLPVFLIMIILIPSLIVVLFLIYNFIVYAATGRLSPLVNL